MRADNFNIYDMLRRCSFAFGERPAIVHEGGVTTHRQLLERVDAMATGLAGHSLAKGDRVCILAQNHPAYLEIYGACAKLGLMAYPINWRLTTEEIERIVERAAPRVMVVDDASLSQVAGWPAARKNIPYWYQIGETMGEGFTPIDNLYIQSGAEPAPEVAAEEGLLVISTAAVDLVPRGAVLTHANLLTSNTLTAHAFGLSEDDGNLLALPLFHIAALGTALAVMQAGGVNALMTRYDPAEAVRLIDAHKLTVVSSFPPVLSALLDAAAEGGSKLASLKHVTGLEGPEVIERLEKETSARFWIGFGQSETTGFISLQRASDKPGAAGRPAALCQIKLVDEEENDVPMGAAGEILVRGPLVMKEYFAQPEVTTHTFRGGWHHTGDLGKFDEEGYLHYAGRKPEKELIKPGGENVYPAEVEAVIMEMEGVTGVCVFGVPDEQWGEAIRAVVEAEGKEAAEIIDHVGSRIARYKRPKTVEFTGEIPRTAAGEVDRDAVKAKWG